MVKNERYEILTPKGFQNFESVTKSSKKLIKINTVNHYCVVSENHPFEVMGDLFNSCDLKVGMLLDTISGLEAITEIKPLNVTQNVYDVINVQDCGIYYGNGILQHNCFHGSTYTLVELEDLQRKKKELNIDHMKFDKFPIQNYNIKIFKKPVPGRSYVIGGDVGDGVGANESIITVYDITNPIDKVEQVASFSHNKVSRPELAYLLAKIGNIYNYGPILLERNNMGSSVIDFLSELYEYENLVRVELKKEYGVLSNNKIKVDACLNFKTYVDNPDINTILYDSNLYQQLEWFERKDLGNGGCTYLGTNKKLDDHVLASIWAFYVLKPDILQYYFDFDIVNVGLEKIPSNLVSYTTNTRSHEKDEFYDRIFNQIKERELDQLESEESVNHDIDNTQARYSMESLEDATIDSSREKEAEYFDNIGFFPI